jgi:COP9 signalosome complex subunit 7
VTFIFLCVCALCVLDCAGLVRGRLDQKDKCFLVDFATSRDIRPGQIDGLIRALKAWCDESDRLLRAIDEQMGVAASSHEAYRQHRKEYEERVEAMKKTVAAQEAEGGAHGMVMDPFDDDPRGRKYASVHCAFVPLLHFPND